jgi:hypothetical protein
VLILPDLTLDEKPVQLKKNNLLAIRPNTASEYPTPEKYTTGPFPKSWPLPDSQPVEPEELNRFR